MGNLCAYTRLIRISERDWSIFFEPQPPEPRPLVQLTGGKARSEAVGGKECPPDVGPLNLTTGGQGRRQATEEERNSNQGSGLA